VSEPLNETVADYYGERRGPGMTIIGRQRVLFDTAEKAAKLRRSHVQLHQFAPVLTFAPVPKNDVAGFLASHKVSYSGLSAPLPSNVHLLTLANNGFFSGSTNSVLVRLAHLYEVGEDPDMSKPATVDLEGFLSHLKLSACTEMTLSANQPLASVQRMTWTPEVPFPPVPEFNTTHPTLAANLISINPMEIRTFACYKA
jgi:hypothetical protein